MAELINADDFLTATAIIDWRHPAVHSLAIELAGGDREPQVVARRCFEWVAMKSSIAWISAASK